MNGIAGQQHKSAFPGLTSLVIHTTSLPAPFRPNRDSSAGAALLLPLLLITASRITLSGAWPEGTTNVEQSLEWDPSHRSVTNDAVVRLLDHAFHRV